MFSNDFMFILKTFIKTCRFNNKHINIKPLSHKTAIPQRLCFAQKYVSALWVAAKYA